MNLLRVLILWLTFVLSFASGEHLVPGSCSQKCQKVSGRSEAAHSLLLKCSCSSSCSMYSDCCFDSPYRNETSNSKTRYNMCLSLSTVGRFQAVGKCPRNWPESYFCTESIGHLPPVTSLDTGTTYASVFCAICHGDYGKLKRWNVELRCCPEHENLDGRRYVYRFGHFWSVVPTQRKCLCTYVAHYDDTSFTKDLELRQCDKSLEISKCSSSWVNDEVQDLCKSFLDPVYVGHKIYRNLYCAQCNYERLDNAKCMPTIVDRKLSEGSNISEIFEFCVSNHLRACVHYLTHFNRGRSYTFSSLLNIREVSCVPPPGKRCCDGEIMDFRAKRCRKIVD
ncbi:uncharacterized protein NPIL_303411 [Nephila pilipes]|uniref:SMB domain-containing protein n=1 Tax=Nephila pilipes TaxID=299642 RepID=A0A8X6QH24_NEPPI|nr:uncharacterized protein NPIL_303411 [Nephila pilipes]